MISENKKPLKGYEGLYEVSDHGHIYSIDRYNEYQDKRGFLVKRRVKGGRLKQQVNPKTGYSQIVISKNGELSGFNVHRLVAEAFVDNPYNKPTVNHIDSNRNNNHIKNLEWATSKEQINHAINKGRMNYIRVKKTQCGKGHEFTVENTWIGNVGSKKIRRCRACDRIRKNKTIK